MVKHPWIYEDILEYKIYFNFKASNAQWHDLHSMEHLFNIKKTKQE